MSNLSIKSKLLIMLLSVSAISIGVVATLNYLRSYEAMRESVFAHLTSARATKAHQIEQAVANTRANIGVLGSSTGIGDIAREFVRGSPRSSPARRPKAARTPATGRKSELMEIVCTAFPSPWRGTLLRDITRMSVVASKKISVTSPSAKMTSSW